MSNTPNSSNQIQQDTNLNRSSTTTEQSSGLYTINGVNIFEEAEPYYYGIGTPISGKYKPIGEDQNPTTEEDKIQVPEKNGFSIINKLNTFKINNTPISYIKNGTFPKIEVDGQKRLTPIWSTETANSYTLTLRYNEDDINILESVTIKTEDGNEEVEFTKDYFKNNYNLKEIPTRLGFILVGGGGGGAHWTKIKAACCCDETVEIPGTGGAGGAIFWGVINLEKYKSENQIEYTRQFIFNVGAGGKAGEASGAEGEAGEASGVESCHVLNSTTTTLKKLFTVPGGPGGKTCNANSKNEQALALSVSKPTFNFEEDGIVVCGCHSGGGSGVVKVVDTDAGPNQALDFKIFLSSSAEDTDNYSYHTQHDAMDTIFIGNKDSITDLNNEKNYCIPGGHSLGQGGFYLGDSNIKPTKGAGGCAGGEWGRGEPYSHRHGAPGYFALFY